MKRQWRSGPPPEKGWWPASADQYPNPNVIRWWDGKYWSVGAYPHMNAKTAQSMAILKSSLTDQIKWTDRWWL